jgi:hypothetical protein
LQFTGGRIARGTVIRNEQIKDVSLIHVDGYRHPHAFRVAAAEPRLPCVAITRGFPLARSYRVRKGHVWPNQVPQFAARGMRTVTGGAYQGESGGPITNERDEIIGVMSMTDGRTTDIAGWRSVVACTGAMERYLAGFSVPPRVYAQCADGSCQLAGGGNQPAAGAADPLAALDQNAGIPFGGDTNPTGGPGGGLGGGDTCFIWRP